MDAAVRADRGAIENVTRASNEGDDDWPRSLRARLAAGPDATKRELLSLLERWNDAVFGPGLSGTAAEAGS